MSEINKETLKSSLERILAQLDQCRLSAFEANAIKTKLGQSICLLAEKEVEMNMNSTIKERGVSTSEEEEESEDTSEDDVRFELTFQYNLHKNARNMVSRSNAKRKLEAMRTAAKNNLFLKLTLESFHIWSSEDRANSKKARSPFGKEEKEGQLLAVTDDGLLCKIDGYTRNIEWIVIESIQVVPTTEMFLPFHNKRIRTHLYFEDQVYKGVVINNYNNIECICLQFTNYDGTIGLCKLDPQVLEFIKCIDERAVDLPDINKLTLYRKGVSTMEEWNNEMLKYFSFSHEMRISTSSIISLETKILCNSDALRPFVGSLVEVKRDMSSGNNILVQLSCPTSFVLRYNVLYITKDFDISKHALPHSTTVPTRHRFVNIKLKNNKEEKNLFNKGSFQVGVHILDPTTTSVVTRTYDHFTRYKKDIFIDMNDRQSYGTIGAFSLDYKGSVTNDWTPTNQVLRDFYLSVKSTDLEGTRTVVDTLWEKFPLESAFAVKHRNKVLCEWKNSNADTSLSSSFWEMFDEWSPMMCLNEWTMIVKTIVEDQETYPILSTLLTIDHILLQEKDKLNKYEIIGALYIMTKILFKYKETDKIGAEFKTSYEDVLQHLLNFIMKYKLTINLNKLFLEPVLKQLTDVQWIVKIVICYPTLFSMTEFATFVNTYEGEGSLPYGRDTIAFIKRFVGNLDAENSAFEKRFERYRMELHAEYASTKDVGLARLFRKWIKRGCWFRNRIDQEYWSYIILIHHPNSLQFDIRCKLHTLTLDEKLNIIENVI
jgi:hypothetical protein